MVLTALLAIEGMFDDGGAFRIVRRTVVPHYYPWTNQPKGDYQTNQYQTNQLERHYKILLPPGGISSWQTQNYIKCVLFH